MLTFQWVSGTSNREFAKLQTQVAFGIQIAIKSLVEVLALGDQMYNLETKSSWLSQIIYPSKCNDNLQNIDSTVQREFSL